MTLTLPARRSLAVVVLTLAAGLAPSVPAVHAAEVSFDAPTASAVLGRPLTFETTFRAASAPSRVEVLTRLPTEEGVFVREAEVTREGRGFRARVVEDEGHNLPNTTIVYRFRVTTGERRELGPEARVTVTDDRFDWRVREGRLVRLHWYEGDEAFAERALRIGEEAVASVAALLGVSESEPIDFFVYAAEGPFRDAMGPGTRENVGGRASSEIRTLFALIEPSAIDSDWVEVVIPHELIHLVFHTAVDNPYHEPPKWLNEGIAVYLSEGYKEGDRQSVRGAVADGSIIPLDGLTGQFPTTREGFFLAYAESVSAVDYFIRTHGRDTLVKLVRSYQKGLSDDEAFQAATGRDVKSFNEAWLRDLGAAVPQPVGPRPAPLGPLPPDWTASPAGGTAGGPDTAPAGVPTGRGGARGDALVLVGVLLAAATLAAGLFLARRRDSRAGPPQ